MKRILSILSFLCLTTMLGFMSSCSKSDSNPFLDSQLVSAYDLVQLTNENPDFPITLGFSDNKSIDSVVAIVFPKGGDSTNPTTKNTITGLNNTSISSAKITLSFPTLDKAPNGIYTVRITMYSGGKATVKTYNVNVINNKAKKFCTFASKPLPAGKNTWVRLTSTVPVAATDDVYMTGNFESSNGGSDWSGGNALFKMTRLSDNCFELAVNLTSSNEFKFTLGDWGRERLDNTGGTPGNSKGDLVKDGVLEITAYNWKTYTVVPQQLPEVIPTSAIKTGMMTIVADLQNQNIGSNSYYVVKEGGDVSDTKYKLAQVGSTTRFAVAVPQTVDKYYVVRNNGNTTKIDTGVTAVGSVIKATWDGQTNPNRIVIPFFTGDAGIVNTLYITGDATPDGWTNSPSQTQKMTKNSNGIFEITMSFVPGKLYKFLSSFGNWQPQFGGTSDSGGALGANYGGGNDPSAIPTPQVAGNYKISVNLVDMSYTVTKI